MVKKKRAKKESPEKKTNTKKKCNLLNNIKNNYWAVATIVLAAILILTLAYSGSESNPSAISADVVGQKVIDFAKAQGAEAELVSVTEEESLFTVTVKIEGQEGPLYVTKDGENLVPSLVPLEITEQPAARETPAPQNIPTSNKPTAELFIMTHCPYGAQAEKGFLPVMRLLEEEANLEVKFVHYFMHDPEKTETPIQVCIREEFPENFDDYLECFLKGDGNVDSRGFITAGNDPETCMKEVGIKKSKVDECISSGKAEEYYAKDSEESKAYGVQGSPTLVVNGVIVSSGRSPQAYLDNICQAFNKAPEDCNKKVSTATPIEFFGWKDKTGSATAATCG